MDGNLTINLPQQQVGDVKKEIVIKFLDIGYYPATINGYGADTIDGNGTFQVSVPLSAIRLYIPQHHSWLVV
jgi:hypothetical protein